jgi:response regulator RpfG family c-di-GMP phosphodiesterase
VLNTNVDTVEMLRAALDAEGFLVTSAFIDEIARGESDLEPMVRMHPPSAIIFDVAIPYDRTWAFKNQLQQHPGLKDVPFVVTTTNVHRLREIVTDAGDDVIEIVGKPYDLGQIVETVRRVSNTGSGA